MDGWAARIRADVAGVPSLAEARDRLDALQAWTADPALAPPDVEAAVAALQAGFAAARLAGRYDVAVETGETADLGESFQHARLPFGEQIDFFRRKLDVSTRAWTDVWQAEHDRAFMVAGAAHADLVSDLRGAVDKAIADGTPLAAFRKDFDGLVAKHGWSYKGGRDWRAGVIYGTNLRTSYAAGRYQQMKAVAERRPFWRYRHSHASDSPRQQHLAWDGLVLRHDDPFWDTHAPPNGWGCKCYIEALNDRDLKRLGKSGPDQAPAVRTREVTVGVRGPNPRTVRVPEGIDPGWAYAPGQSVARPAPPSAPPADPFAIGEMSRADATARRVGPQKGSNPGGAFRGADGRVRYVKLYDDPAQSYGEAVANRAYRELGIDAPVSVLVRDGERVVGVANEIIDHSGALGAAKRGAKGRSREVLKGYAADVWLANWDAVGLDLDNVVATRARRNGVARIDAGGALLMRARQGRKPAGVLSRITEWDGFADAARNPAYTRVLRDAGVASPDDLGRSALARIRAIDELGRRTRNFRDLAPDVRGVPQADRDAIRQALSRRARLLRQEIAPRVRAAMRTPAYERAFRAEMQAAYTQHLRPATRKVEEGFDKHAMTDPELVAAYAYTTSGAEWGYRRLNEALTTKGWEGEPALPARYDHYRRTLDAALDRLPDYPARNLRRGATLRYNDIAGYVVGEVKTERRFLSTSTGRGFSGNVRFTIHGRHGKRIERLSAFPSEEEVLFKAETKFLVVGKRRDEAGVTHIEMEEVDDG